MLKIRKYTFKRKNIFIIIIIIEQVCRLHQSKIKNIPCVCCDLPRRTDMKLDGQSSLQYGIILGNGQSVNFR